MPSIGPSTVLLELTLQGEVSIEVFSYDGGVD